MGWENYFGIQIPDPVAEKINTVQQAVDAIAELLNITSAESGLQPLLLDKLQNALTKTGLSNKVISPDVLVCSILPENSASIWITLSNQLNLQLPHPPDASSAADLKLGARIGSFLFRWKPAFVYAELTFSELTAVIAAANIEKLISGQSIRSKYEIYIALMAITVDKIGIDYYEFKPGKSFTSDFGID